jgi:hypothetical protein
MILMDISVGSDDAYVSRLKQLIVSQGDYLVRLPRTTTTYDVFMTNLTRSSKYYSERLTDGTLKVLAP